MKRELINLIDLVTDKEGVDRITEILDNFYKSYGLGYVTSSYEDLINKDDDFQYIKEELISWINYLDKELFD